MIRLKHLILLIIVPFLIAASASETRFLWSDSYLQSLLPLDPQVDTEMSLVLAGRARSYGSYSQSKGFCLRAVRAALNLAFKALTPERLSAPSWHLKSFEQGWGSAEAFRSWAIDNPGPLCFSLGLEALGKRAPEISAGMILVYGKGRCQFHPRYGHIEVVTNSLTSEACSDHCRQLVPDCVPDLILAPTSNCRKFSRGAALL